MRNFASWVVAVVILAVFLWLPCGAAQLSYFRISESRKINEQDNEYKEIVSQKDYINKIVSAREYENAKYVRQKVFENMLSGNVNLCPYAFEHAGDVIMGYRIPPGNTLLSIMQPSPMLMQPVIKAAVANVAQALARVHKIGFNEKFLTSDLVHNQLYLSDSIYCLKDKVIFHNTEKMWRGSIIGDISDLFNKYLYFKISGNRNNFVESYLRELLGYKELVETTVINEDYKENSILIEMEEHIKRLKIRIDNIVMNRKQYQCSLIDGMIYESSSKTNDATNDATSNATNNGNGGDDGDDPLTLSEAL
ncbi:MAG: hypothetical protein LBG13_03045 [Holosporales bacterium]|nr:hypothetical protein [Holosporales bacterium]